MNFFKRVQGWLEPPELSREKAPGVGVNQLVGKQKKAQFL